MSGNEISDVSVVDESRSVEKKDAASYDETLDSKRQAHIVDEEFGGTEARKKLEVSIIGHQNAH